MTLKFRLRKCGETASWVFGVEPDFVTPELRRVAKMVNFGLLYGMSAFGLAERLGVDRGEAAGIVRRYFDILLSILSKPTYASSFSSKNFLEALKPTIR